MDELGITPLMPLDFWRQEIGYSPWHFWGLADTNIVPVTSACNDVVREYSWQSTDQAGRNDIRQMIQQAEQILFDNLSWWPAPAYSFEIHPWPRYNNLRLMRMGRSDAQGRWIPIQLNEGFIQACGVEALTVIQAAAALVYTDEDGDGLSETFTITVATALTDPKEIAIYFVIGDRLDEDQALSDRWRIEPVNIQIIGGNAIIKGKRWLCVKPELYEDKDHYPIDPTVAGNFITTADVYRRYTDMTGTVSSTNSQSALIWESRPCLWGCSSSIPSSTDPSSEGWVAGRAGIRDSDIGIVIPAEAVYDASTGLWSHPSACITACSEPDRVLIRYLAGKQLDANGHMYKPMRTLVSRLACAEMTRRICACDSANREWSNWQFDVSRINAPEVYQMNIDVLNNPLGTRRGHIYAWQQIKGLARVTGMLS